jgi:hypothetical protein
VDKLSNLENKTLSYYNPKYDCYEYQKIRDIENDNSLIPILAYKNRDLIIDILELPILEKSKKLGNFIQKEMNINDIV